MIILRSRSLIIPNDEYNLGNDYDTNTATRVFQLDRVMEGIDLANLMFKLDLTYADGTSDTLALDSEVTDDKINLTWTVTKNQLHVPGTVVVQIRALNVDGNMKWTSYIGAFFVEASMFGSADYSGKLTEVEQFEVAIKSEKERVQSEKARQDAEAERVQAEAERKSAEEERKTAEAERKSAETVRSNAETARESAETEREEWYNSAKTNFDAAIASGDKAETIANSLETNVEANMKAAAASATAAAGSASAAAGSANEAKQYSQNLSNSNVLSYGADPTGVRDSTAEIQNALRSGKKHVIIPSGTYICNWARIPSDVSVHGYGAKLVATTGNAIFTNDADGVTGGWGANSNIVIEGIDFSAPNAAQCTLVGMGHCTNVVIRNCTFHDIKVWHFIEFNSCKSCMIDNCYFYNYGTADGGYSEMVQLDYAVSSDTFPWFGPYDSTPTDDTKIVNCSFIGNSDILSVRTPAGIGNHTGGSWVIRDTEISNCYFENLGSALKFVTCHDIAFNNNIVRDCNMGIYMGGNIGQVQISNNALRGRSNWTSSSDYRGIFIEYLNESTMLQVIGNNIDHFGNHGVTLQGTFINCLDNHITCNGKHGLYTGWAEFGSKYSNNTCWGNNQINEESSPCYDFYFNLTRANLPSDISVGDILINNNKFSSCCFNVSDSLENTQKSYCLSNVIKGTFVKTNNDLVTYGDNWNGNTPTDIVTVSEIGNFYEVWLTSTQLSEKAWTTLNGSVNIPVAGTYHIEGFFSTYANVDNNYGSVRITNTLPRTSFQYTINENSARVVYVPIDVTLKLDANTTLTLDVWSGKVTTGDGWIRATRIG